MTLGVTLALLALAGATLGACIMAGRRPYRPGRPPLVPLGLVAFLSILAMLMLLSHLISLVTGEPFRGRIG